MIKKRQQPKAIEEVAIVLPANAVDTIFSQQLSHNGGTLGPLESNHLRSAALSGRNESFPCLKSSRWNEQVRLLIVYS